MTQPERKLSLLDCVGLGVNGIIGSGIYLQLAPLAQRAGPPSILGVLGCGLLCCLIALCFAELSGMYDRSGGPYVYAREAFGPYVGFAVGWMSMATGVLGYAAVAVGFAEALVPASPSAGVFTPRALVGVALIAALGAINYLGVKAGARTMDLLSLAKVVPLVALALLGLPGVRREVVASVFSPAAVPTGDGFWPAVGGAAFLAFFMLSGFEYVPVPAGEVRNARRAIPLATVGSVLGATLLYCALMLGVYSALPDVGGRDQPLPAFASALVGPWGGWLLRGTALVSMAGFCAGSALVGPRYFTALAEDGFLPGWLTGLSRFGTPGPAILLTTAVSAVLALFLGYASLVDLSLVALLAQYIPAALAVPVLRRLRGDTPRAWRLPGGLLIPLLAAVGAVTLAAVARPSWSEWLVSAELLLGGAALWGLTRLSRRLGRGRAAVKPAPPPGAG